MSLQAVLLPLFVEVILTFVLMLRMGALRSAAYRFRGGQIGRHCAARTELAQAGMQAAYSFSNQFELPVLFYVLTILEWVTRHAGLCVCHPGLDFRRSAALLQAYVHVTSNKVRLRGAFYSVGAVVLMVMWVIYIVEVLSGGIL